jgi:hypothetical protein
MALALSSQVSAEPNSTPNRSPLMSQGTLLRKPGGSGFSAAAFPTINDGDRAMELRDHCRSGRVDR